MVEKTRTVTVARRPFTLRATQIERALRDVLPEPVRDHFVVVNQRRYPPKQVLVHVTGLDRAEFTTHHARRILTGLGFPAGRRTHEPAARAASRQGSPLSGRPLSGRTGRGAAPPPSGSRPSVGRSRPSAAALDPFVGQWVATKGEEVLVGAGEPGTVVRWLAQHNQQADSMFRVASDEHEASGAAPL